MTPQASATAGPPEQDPVRLERLLPPGGQATVPEIVEQLGLWERPPATPQRPRGLCTIISTVDRRALARVGGGGGPPLRPRLLAAGLLDELFLCLAPKLAGGEPAGGEALRIL